MAGDIQIAVHKWIDNKRPSGWDNQLKDELGFNLYHKRARGFRHEGGRIDHELIAHTGVTLGNVSTYAEAGAIYRLGYDVPDDVGGQILGQTHLPNHDRSKKWSAYIYMGAAGRIVARDIFLDGNTFKDSHSVDKKALIAELIAGLIVRYKSVEFGYTTSLIPDQFRGQEINTSHGTIFVRVNRRY